jgi:signal transduction histidine kinase
VSAPGMSEGTTGLALLCDPQGTVSEVVRDGLGVAAAQTVGRPLTALVDPDCEDKAASFLRTLRSQQAAFNWEMNVPVKGRMVPLHFAGAAADGGYLVVAALSRAGVTRFYEELMRINNEQANALRAALKDASLQTRGQTERDARLYDELSHLNNELATTQRELAKKNVELARLNEQKNQFLGIAAHDLRNPLEVILTYSEFLLEDTAAVLGPEQTGLIHTIRSSSEFMLRLVEDLLDVTRIEAGRLELDLVPADLPAIVAANVGRNRVLAAKKGIEISLQSQGEIPRMKLDVAKIEQVLDNLIGNAVKFSSPGSPVDVRLDRDEDRDGERVILSVRDRGPGISAEVLSHLFEPFSRAHVRGTSGEKGAGLGLAIVQRIVTGHGGEIRVESEPGKGATFRVCLPLSLDRPPATGAGGAA